MKNKKRQKGAKTRGQGNKREASVVHYGHDDGIKLIVATVHEGRKVIAMGAFDAVDFDTEEEVFSALLSFVKHFRVTQCNYSESVLPLSEAYCACGEIAARAYDRSKIHGG